jgi:hypothetical protein
MSSEEREEILERINLLNLEAEAFSNGNLTAQELTATWATTQPTMDRVGRWALAKEQDSLTEMKFEAVNSIGKKIPHIVIGLVVVWLLNWKVGVLLETVQYLANQIKP